MTKCSDGVVAILRHGRYLPSTIRPQLSTGSQDSAWRLAATGNLMRSPCEGSGRKSAKRKLSMLTKAQLAALEPLAAFVAGCIGSDDVELVCHRSPGIATLG